MHLRGLIQLLWTGAGAIPALIMLGASLRKRGHPWRWFLITALINGGWASFMASEY